MNLKNLLKRSSLLYTINTKLKATIIKHRYCSMQKHYTRIANEHGIMYSEEKAISYIRPLLEQRGIHPSPISKGQLRIFYVGTIYQQDSSGILQGLEKFGEVIPLKNCGNYGQILPTRTTIGSTRKNNSEALIEQIQEALKTNPIHAVIGQMWSATMDPLALQHLREMGLIVVNISMDDRHAFHRAHGKKCYKGIRTGTAGLVPAIDLAATAARECCLWYLVEGCPAIYWPEASDPNLFRPSYEPKIYDVCFIGKNYGIRTELVKAIEKSGIHVECYGSGWSNGRIPTEKIPELFAHSKIVLGVGTIGYCKDFYALKMRDFDGPMSGSLYLTHRNPDLEDLFVIGKEIECYRNVDECVEKVHYYLKHPDEAESIGRAGRARAEQEHTWEKRFEKLLRTIGLLI